ncbi:hypothetical protein BJY24_007484 [Nocardia transvalensis]|uniref:Uncharacterized protein n=1 Tax=Nocardia transvalensis TaxID=37333 RepID=A0A7W9UMP1_9NOCA|nr:hypothetical protein [Nocardia transvalensis]MBB5918572.1 hypothetical protein [Nocardia transvalensis]
MRTKLLAGIPAAALLASGVALVFAPAAQAVPTYSCTAQSVDGQQLDPVVVEARNGATQARLRARPEWRGQAKFDTIQCTPTGGQAPSQR